MVGRAPRAEDPCQKNVSELANYNTILGGARERGVWGSGPLLKIIIDGVIKSSMGRPLISVSAVSVLHYIHTYNRYTAGGWCLRARLRRLRITRRKASR